MKVVVGELKKAYAFPKALIGFQSFSQFLSFLGTFAFGMAVLYSVQWLFGLKFLTGGVVLGAFIGSLISVYAVLPYRFSLQCDSLGAIKSSIEGRLNRSGYIPRGVLYRYESKVPRILRWNENSLEIVDFGGGNFQVIGAAFPVRVLWRYLRSSYN